MIKRAILLCLALVVTVSMYGQRKERNLGYLNPRIYDSRGQYIKEVPTDAEQGFLQMDAFVLENKFYPRLTFSGFSSYRSDYGVCGFGEIGKVRNAGFSEKGYPLEEDIYISVSAAFSTYIKREYRNEAFFFIGMGYMTEKSFLGPMAGFMLHNKKWSIESRGQISLKGNFEKYYEDYGVKYFDPNSWYKIDLLRKFGDYFACGLFSERFYLTGISCEFKVPDIKNCLGLKIKTYVGQDFVSDKLSFGLALNLMTLDK